MTTKSITERKKELRKLIQEKTEKMETIQKEADLYNSMQLAFKLILNGSYGAFANKHFTCFCNGVASSITAHGRDLIKIMDRAGNYYFKKMWHLDTELHAILGVTDVKQIPETEECCVYVDTDSNFFTFKPAFDSCDWQGDPLEFVHLVSKHRLTGYFKNVLEKYATKYNVDNKQDFELEQVSKSIIFIEKKRYIKNVIWEDGSPNDSNPEWQKNGSFYEAETDLQAKGIQLVRSDSPLFAREKVKNIIKYFFKNGKSINDRELVKLVRDLKNQFKVARIEDICMSSSCSNYEIKVLDDTSKLEFVLGAHHSVKAAGLYNYLLNQQPELKSKYNMIKSGDKIKYYFTKHSMNDKFAFLSGMFPYELESVAPIDYDMQFEKSILNIINSFTKVLGLSELNGGLTYTSSIF